MSAKKESTLKLQKKVIAKEISKKLKDAKALVIAEYRGLTVKELTELRVLAKKSNIDLMVYKNRIFKFGLKAAKVKGLDEYLTGPNIFAFSNEDDIAASKLLVNFSKDHKYLVPKAGIFEDKVIDANGVREVATLPNYEEALTILARSLMSPLQQLSLSLKLFSEKDEQTNEQTQQ